MEQRGRTRQFAAPWNGDERTTVRSLLPPLLLLSIAVLLPSVDQAQSNRPHCDLMFVFHHLELGLDNAAHGAVRRVIRQALCRRLPHSCQFDPGCLSLGASAMGVPPRRARTTAQNQSAWRGQEIALIIIAGISGGRQ